jgi:hypothetical protein
MAASKVELCCAPHDNLACTAPEVDLPHTENSDTPFNQLFASLSLLVASASSTSTAMTMPFVIPPPII